MKFIQLIFIVLILFNFSYSKNTLEDFLEKLAGTTWIVGEGENYKIYPSAARFRPRKVAMIEFLKSGVNIQYANLDTSSYYSTAETVRDVIKQFGADRKDNPTVLDASLGNTKFDEDKIFVHKDDINKQYSALHVVYKPYNDTTWTLHKAAQEKLGKGYDSAYIRFGPNDSTYYKQDFDIVYTESKPLMTLYRKFDSSRDGNTFDMQNGTFMVETVKIEGTKDEYDTIYRTMYAKTNVDLFSVTGYEPYAFESFDRNMTLIGGTMVAEYVLADKADFKTAKLGFWRVHIAPEVWWSPRNDDGFIDHDSLETHANAMNFRDSVLNYDKKEYDNWINPVLNDTMSTILSISFVMPNEPATENIIYLDQQDRNKALDRKPSKEDMYYTHIPKRMYKVEGDINNDTDIKKALIQLFARNSEEEKQAKELYDRCGFGTSIWEDTDIENSYVIFPAKDTTVKDTAITAENDTNITNKTITLRRRARDIDDGVFMYNYCPCSKDEKLGNLTKFEVKKYIYKSIPAHSLGALDTAITLWGKLKCTGYLDDEDDQKILKEKINKAKYVRDKIRQMYKENNIKAENVKSRKSWINDGIVENIVKGEVIGVARCE